MSEWAGPSHCRELRGRGEALVRMLGIKKGRKALDLE